MTEPGFVIKFEGELELYMLHELIYDGVSFKMMRYEAPQGGSRGEGIGEVMTLF